MAILASPGVRYLDFAGQGTGVVPNQPMSRSDILPYLLTDLTGQSFVISTSLTDQSFVIIV